MIIGLKKECKIGEGRVAVTPSDMKLLLNKFQFKVEEGAGEKSGFSDENYIEAGASVVSRSHLWSESDMVIGVKEPIYSEFKHFKEGGTIFSYLHLADNMHIVRKLLKSKVTAIALENITEDGRHPALDPMSVIAGKISAHLCVQHFFNYDNGKLLGGIVEGRNDTDGKAVVIGAGAAGMAAANILADLGMKVIVYDVNRDTMKRQRSLLRHNRRRIDFKMSEPDISLEGVDVLISAVLIPGSTSPKVILEHQVKQMPKGSVIVDICIDQGGAVETSHMTDWSEPSYEFHGVTHICVPNLPGITPVTSSKSISKVFLEQLSKFSGEVGDIPESLTGAVSLKNDEILDDIILHLYAIYLQELEELKRSIGEDIVSLEEGVDLWN
jgi:alanine dehydrogenase